MLIQHFAAIIKIDSGIAAIIFFALEMVLLIANFRRRLSMSNFHHRNKWDKIEQHKIKIIVAAHKSHRKIDKRIYIYITRCIYVPGKLDLQHPKSPYFSPILV